MTKKDLQEQIDFLSKAEAALGIEDREDMVALLDGVDYNTYGKWRRGERGMSAGARTAINELLCMKRAHDAGVSAWELWQSRCVYKKSR